MATKSAARKSPAKKSTAKRARKSATAKKSGAARKGAGNAAGKTASKGARKSAAKGGNYSDPALRERLKKKIMAGSKGGRPGQWSARKAQLLAHDYEAQGGGYSGRKTAAQKHLGSWTKEEWQTADGKPAARGKTTARYLPKKAWDELTPAEKRATDRKKRAGSKRGRQFVGNTKRAAAARKSAAKRPASKRPAAKRASGKRASGKRASGKRASAKRSS